MLFCACTSLLRTFFGGPLSAQFFSRISTPKWHTTVATQSKTRSQWPKKSILQRRETNTLDWDSRGYAPAAKTYIAPFLSPIPLKPTSNTLLYTKNRSVTHDIEVLTWVTCTEGREIEFLRNRVPKKILYSLCAFQRILYLGY